jgi:AcrR family transcriptional regulator
VADDAREETRTRIVEAAAGLMREHGAAAVTTRAVAGAAGVQAPTIYRVFGDKDGLLEAMAEHVMSTWVSDKAARVSRASSDGVDPVADLRDGWAQQIDFSLAHPDLHRLLSEPARAGSSPAVAAGLEVLRARVRRVAEAGRLRVSEERAVGLVLAAGAGAVQALLALPADERDLTLADDLLDAVLGQVLTDAPTRQASGGGAVTAAVTLAAHVDRLDVLSDGERRLLIEWLGRITHAEG